MPAPPPLDAKSCHRHFSHPRLRFGVVREKPILTPLCMSSPSSVSLEDRRKHSDLRYLTTYLCAMSKDTNAQNSTEG